MLRNRWSGMVAALFPLVVAVGCGEETTSSTSLNWGTECSSDSDCGSLSCLCGICTETCSTDVDCEPLATETSPLICALNGTESDCVADGPVCISASMVASGDVSGPAPAEGGAPGGPAPDPSSPNGGSGGDEPNGGASPSTSGGAGGDGAGGSGGGAGASGEAGSASGGAPEVGGAGNAGDAGTPGGAGGEGPGGGEGGEAMGGMGGVPIGDLDAGVDAGVPEDAAAPDADGGTVEAGIGGAETDGGMAGNAGSGGAAGAGGNGGSAGSGGAGGAAGGGGNGGTAGAGGSGGCTELGSMDDLVTDFDDWDTTTDPEDWVFDWSGNDTTLTLEDSFPQRQLTFVTESSMDYALRAYSGPTEQNGGTIVLTLADADACIDASVFDGIEITLRGAITTSAGEFEIGFTVNAPANEQPDTLLFDLGTDIDDEVVLQIPFDDFGQDMDPALITGVTIGLDKGTGGSYELIVDDIQFY